MVQLGRLFPALLPDLRIAGLWGDGKEVELSLGSFDRPGLFQPQYELWITRREPWLAPLHVAQFRENRA